MLSVLAMLSLSTVLAQQRMAHTSHQAVTDYYAADLEAQIIFARLRQGEVVPEVSLTGDQYSYHVPISSHQTLYVELTHSDNGWTVLRWQAVPQPEEVSQTLPVWQGS